jgi:hypothetical protein
MADAQSVTLGDKANPVRFHFLYAHKPKVQKNPKPGEVPMYTTMVLVPKAGNFKPQIEAAMRAAAANSRETRGVAYEALDLVLRDGDDPKELAKKEAKHPGASAYLKGHWFFNCKSKQKPEVVGTVNVAGPGEKRKLNRLEEGDIKWGDYGRITIRFYGYVTDGKQGIAASMGNIQKLRGGEPLGNRADADSDFEAEMDQEDDLLK